jgi:hypothetical protein
MPGLKQMLAHSDGAQCGETPPEGVTWTRDSTNTTGERRDVPPAAIRPNRSTNRSATRAPMAYAWGHAVHSSAAPDRSAFVGCWSVKVRKPMVTDFAGSRIVSTRAVSSYGRPWQDVASTGRATTALRNTHAHAAKALALRLRYGRVIIATVVAIVLNLAMPMPS